MSNRRRWFEPRHETLPFDSIYDEWVVKRDSERIHKNSRDDFGLGQGWLFITGKHIDGEWTTAWGRVNRDRRNETEPCMCEGRIGSLQLSAGVGEHEGKVRATANDTVMITSDVITRDVTDIPDEIARLIR